MKPQFNHDCSACIFLGTYEHTDNHTYDLYACPSGFPHTTVIARFSSNGPDYTSGICFGMQAIIEDRQHPLRVAIERAKEKGIDLGPEADISRVTYCEKHKVKIAPGTACWNCGMDELIRTVKLREEQKNA